jgi:hypothetical protein
MGSVKRVKVRKYEALVRVYSNADMEESKVCNCYIAPSLSIACLPVGRQGEG